MRIEKGIGLFLIYLLISFPLFYFVYKFGDPEPLAHDFFQYYKLYYHMDVFNTISPHNMRLVGAWFVHLFYKLNLFYDTETAFDKYYQQWGFLKQVYFDAVFFNFICVASTATLIFKLIYEELRQVVLSFIGGVLYLLGFGTLFYHLMPLTDAFSTLLFVAGFFAYRIQSYSIMLVLGLLIFQREYLLLVFGLLACVDLIKLRQRYYLTVLSGSVFCFIVYYMLRATVFYNPALAWQAKPGFMWDSLVHLRFVNGVYFKQLALTLNLFVLYFGVVLLKLRKKILIDKLDLLKIVLLFVQANFLAISGGHGNNVGRYFYLVVPYVIYCLVMEVVPFFRDTLNHSEHGGEAGRRATGFG